MVWNVFRRREQEPPESQQLEEPQPAPALLPASSEREWDEDEDEDEVAEAPAPLVPAVVPVAVTEPAPTVANSPQQAELDQIFEVPQPTDPDMEVGDLLEVDLEKDVLGLGLDDVTMMTEEEILGDANGQRSLERQPRPVQQRQRRQRQARRQVYTPTIISLRARR